MTERQILVAVTLNDTRHNDDGIKSTVARVVLSNIGCQLYADSVTFRPSRIDGIGVGCLRCGTITEAREVPYLVLTRLVGMFLVAFVLVHDVRFINETHVVSTIARSPLVVKGGNRETRCRDGTYLKIARRLFDEAQLTSIRMPTGIDVQGLVVTNNCTVLVSPFVRKSIRCVTSNTRVVTAVFRFNPCGDAVHGKVRIAVVSGLRAVIRDKAHFDMLSVIRLQVHTDGGPILPNGFIILGYIPSGINTVRIRELSLAAAMID